MPDAEDERRDWVREAMRPPARGEEETRLERLGRGVGLVDADAADKLLDWRTLQGAGDPELEGALRELVRAKPYLSSLSEGIDAGAGRQPQRKPFDLNREIRIAAGKEHPGRPELEGLF
jgi:hypothetical protein